jgi:hypothetical protein
MWVVKQRIHTQMSFFNEAESNLYWSTWMCPYTMEKVIQDLCDPRSLSATSPQCQHAISSISLSSSQGKMKDQVRSTLAFRENYTKRDHWYRQDLHHGLRFKDLNSKDAKNGTLNEQKSGGEKGFWNLGITRFQACGITSSTVFPSTSCPSHCQQKFWASLNWSDAGMLDNPSYH